MIAHLILIMPDLARYIICGVLCAVFIVDAVVTVIQLIAYKKNYAAIEKISAALKKPSNVIGGKIAASALELNDKMQKLNAKIKSSRLYKAFPEQSRKANTNAENAEQVSEAAIADDNGCDK